jgi:xanthine dehydrogenase iron-sulfur cluster and FAD-binding subunit A
MLNFVWYLLIGQVINWGYALIAVLIRARKGWDVADWAAAFAKRFDEDVYGQATFASDCITKTDKLAYAIDYAINGVIWPYTVAKKIKAMHEADKDYEELVAKGEL